MRLRYINLFHTKLGWMFAPCMKSLHTSLNIAHSGCILSHFMSSFTHSPQVFLPLPTHLTSAIHTRSFHTFTLSLQMSKPPKSKYDPQPEDCTNQPRRLYKSALCLLSFNNTPHIHLDKCYYFAQLSRICRFSAFSLFHNHD